MMMSAGPNVIDSFHGPYRFLSNFWECDIEYKGFKYKSTEHAYQAAKVEPGSDAFHAIANMSTPGQSKRKAKEFPLRHDWNDIKDEVMLELLRIKFNKPGLGAALLQTGDVELIEGNTWGDKYWGVCDGDGLNKLGKMLMQVREELKAKQIETKAL